MPVTGRILLDTSVVVAVLRRVPGMIERLRGQEELLVPLVVLGELRYGANLATPPRSTARGGANFHGQRDPPVADGAHRRGICTHKGVPEGRWHPVARKRRLDRGSRLRARAAARDEGRPLPPNPGSPRARLAVACWQEGGAESEIN